METKGLKILHNIKIRWIGDGLTWLLQARWSLKSSRFLWWKWHKMLSLLSLKLQFMNCCVTLTPLYNLLVWCLCWETLQVWASMLKTNKPSFVTLWTMWSCVKLICTTYIVMKKRSTTTLTSYSSKLHWLDFWSFAHCVAKQSNRWNTGGNIFLLWQNL